jgi:hypothetical protein
LLGGLARHFWKLFSGSVDQGEEACRANTSDRDGHRLSRHFIKMIDRGNVRSAENGGDAQGQLCHEAYSDAQRPESAGMRITS